MRQRILIGSHLITQRGHYAHHGIYAGRGMVVHYSGKSRGIATGPVAMAHLEEFSQGRGYKVKVHTKPLHRGRAVVDRAKSRLGEDLYNLLGNNCEHFCQWCINGEASSLQVERAAEASGSTLALGMASRAMPGLTPGLLALTGIANPPAVLFAALLLSAYATFQYQRAKDEA